MYVCMYVFVYIHVHTVLSFSDFDKLSKIIKQFWTRFWHRPRRWYKQRPWFCGGGRVYTTLCGGGWTKGVLGSAVRRCGTSLRCGGLSLCVCIWIMFMLELISRLKRRCVRGARLLYSSFFFIYDLYFWKVTNFVFQIK